MPNNGLSDTATAEVNVFHIARLERGMNQVQVLKIMRHPYSDQVFILDNDTYDVWFYVTSRRVLGQSRMMPMNMTPLAFKNGILIGWGNAYYNLIKKRQAEIEKALRPPPPPKPIPKETEQGPENIQLEKVLQKPADPNNQNKNLPPAPSSYPNAPPKNPAPTGESKPGQPVEPSMNLSPLEPQQPPPSPAKPVPGKTQNKDQATQPPPQPQGHAAPQKNQKQGQQQTAPPPPDQPNWGPIGPEQTQPPPQPQGQAAPQKNQNQEQQQPTPPAPNQPNWSPLEEQPQPPANQQPSKTQPPQVSISMSGNPKTQDQAADQGNNQKKTKENKIPLDEEDEEMLHNERDQDFDQT